MTLPPADIAAVMLRHAPSSTVSNALAAMASTQCAAVKFTWAPDRGMAAPFVTAPAAVAAGLASAPGLDPVTAAALAKRGTKTVHRALAANRSIPTDVRQQVLATASAEQDFLTLGLLARHSDPRWLIEQVVGTKAATSAVLERATRRLFASGDGDAIRACAALGCPDVTAFLIKYAVEADSPVPVADLVDGSDEHLTAWVRAEKLLARDSLSRPLRRALSTRLSDPAPVDDSLRRELVRGYALGVKRTRALLEQGVHWPEAIGALVGLSDAAMLTFPQDLLEAAVAHADSGAQCAALICSPLGGRLREDQLTKLATTAADANEARAEYILSSKTVPVLSAAAVAAVIGQQYGTRILRAWIRGQYKRQMPTHEALKLLVRDSRRPFTGIKPTCPGEVLEIFIRERKLDPAHVTVLDDVLDKEFAWLMRYLATAATDNVETANANKELLHRWLADQLAPLASNPGAWELFSLMGASWTRSLRELVAASIDALQ